MPPILSFLLLAVSAWALRFFLHYWTRKRKLPPGPQGLPLLGNVWDVPQHYSWLTFTEWGRKHGDIVSFSVFGRTTVVLNSAKVASEILDKRSFNYSDRPRMVMANELMGWGWDFAHMPYSDDWRRHRRVFHQYFQPRSVSSYHTQQRKMTHILLSRLLQTPDSFMAHVRQHIGSIILKITYGFELKGDDDDYIRLVRGAFQTLLMVVHAGQYLVDFLPWLKYVPSWLPGASFKRNARKWSKLADDLRNVPFNAVKDSMDVNESERCFVSDNLQRLKDEGIDKPEEEEIIKNCAGLAYLAGSDTTVSLVLSWMLAMAHNPDIQAKAQAEIDSVTSGIRLPDFTDRDGGAFPYVEAMLTEAMRWIPVAPLGVPHRAINDDEYNGYLIPAGATITSNTWAILHDPELYPDPWKFRPERYLKDENGKPSCPDPLLLGGFGFGRRACPGRHLAMETAWITIASILASFTISKAKDNAGNFIEPLIEVTDGLVIHPKPFKIQLTARSQKAADLIRSSAQD